MRKEELLAKSIELNNNKEFQKVIDLLTDDELDGFKSSELYSEKAAAYWGFEDLNETLNYSKKALEIDKNDPKALNYFGVVLYQRNRIEEAKNYFLKAIQNDPNYEKPLSNLAVILIKEYNHEEASKYLDKVISINSHFSPAYINYGHLYFQREQFNTAKSYYEKAINIDPENYRGYLGIANIQTHLGKYKEAQEFFKKALAIKPNAGSIKNSLGIHYSRIKENSKAIKCFEEVAENGEEEEKKRAYSNLGLLYMNLGNFQKSEEYLNFLLQNYSMYPSANYNKALWYEKQKNYEKAKKFYQLYVEYELNKSSSKVKYAKSKISDLIKLLKSSFLSEISSIIDEIKLLLQFKEEHVCHFSALSTCKALILDQSEFRISEGTFLNDTSEGKELLNYLDFLQKTNDLEISQIKYSVKPFIGSFVSRQKNNDLTLWRMYGKENNQEAEGCSITLKTKEFISQIYDSFYGENYLLIMKFLSLKSLIGRVTNLKIFSYLTHQRIR